MGGAETMDTELAPVERASEEDIQRQARGFSGLTLLRQLLDAMPNGVMILNRERRAVYANKLLLEALELDDQYPLGLRIGEVLGCVHAWETEGGCGTTEYCGTCGIVKAVLASQCGSVSVMESHVTQKQSERHGSLDLRVWASPFEFKDERFTILAIVDISGEKRRGTLERVLFHDILNTAGLIQAATSIMREVEPGQVAEVERILCNASERLIEEIKTQRELFYAEGSGLSSGRRNDV